MAPRLKVYVDTVSPFAYEAYYILRVRACVFFPSSVLLAVHSIPARI